MANSSFWRIDIVIEKNINMLKNNFRYELILLTRSKWLSILVIGLTLLFAFAVYNGVNNVSKRTSVISKMQLEIKEKDDEILSALSKLDQGQEVDIPRWELPSKPMTIGFRNPRLAVMNAEVFSFVSTGQSDMYTHVKRPKAYGNNFALDYSEMVNPVQLVLGTFDLAFVIIYILPLLIIAFTFNVLSKEKELGTLNLLGAQPISIWKWLVQKMTIRFTVFLTITLLILMVTMTVFNARIFDEIINLLGLVIIITSYIAFWFILAFIVNIKINNSSKNAFVLIGGWLIIVMIIPATINQIGNTVYPTPSRLKMINKIRWEKKINEQMQDVNLSNYLKKNPELDQGKNEEEFGFWPNYFASEYVLEEKISPLIKDYEDQLQKQQSINKVFKYLSPAILMQQSLNNIAGTSERHYNSYKKQVYEFSNSWRNIFIPMVFKDQKFTKLDFEKLPQFNYKNNVDAEVWKNTLIMMLLCVLLFVSFGVVLTRNNWFYK